MRQIATLSVFVSSPNDCRAERQAAREAIERVNASAIAKSHRIVLRPLMWEDLPPGIGTQGDGQSRINEVLERSNLSRYEIYLGFMGGRIGTPTGRAPSGTVEEFREAQASFRARRLPAEVLFYFFGPPSGRAPQVEQFRQEMNQGGVLYSEVADTAAFAKSVELHLLAVVGDWWRWPKRTARAIRFIRPAAVGGLGILAGVLVGGFFLLANGGLRAIRTAADSDRPKPLVDAWAARAPYLFSKRREAVAIANTAMNRMTMDAPNPSSALQIYALWESQSFTETNILEHARRQLGRRVGQEITNDSLQHKPALAFSLLNAGDVVRLWRDDPRERIQAVRFLAEAQLFDGTIKKNNWVTNWDSIGLRDFELAGLRELGRAVSANPTNLNCWGGRQDRLAMLLLAGDTEGLEPLATAALSNLVNPPMPEIEAFIGHASEDVVLHWMRRHIQPNLPGYEFASIVNGVKLRGNIQLALYLLDATIEGKTPYAFLDLNHYSFLGLPGQNRELQRELSARVLGWAKSGVSPDNAILEMVLPYLGPDFFSPADLELLADRLGEELGKQSGWQGAETEALELLARLNTDKAKQFLNSQLKEYLEGRIYGGIGQRAVLMRELPFYAGTNWASQARLLSLVTFHGADDDDLVQAEYLKLMARPGTGTNDWTLQQDQIRQIIDRRALRDTPGLNPLLQPLQSHLWQSDVDHAAEEFIKTLSWKHILELASLSSNWEPIAQFDGRFQRWDYLLRLLGDSKRGWPPEFTQAVWNVVPTDDKLADRWFRAIAVAGGQKARDLFATSLTVRPAAWWVYLGLNGDTNSLEWVGQRVALSAPENLEPFTDAISALPDDERKSFLESWLKKAATDAITNSVWTSLARIDDLKDAKLIDLASNALSHSDSPSELQIAIGYLCAEAPETFQSLLMDPRTRQNFKNTLAHQAEAEWIFITQQISLDHDGPAADYLVGEAEVRPHLFIIDKTHVNLDKHHYFFVGDRVAFNSLVEQLAATSPDKLIPALLRLIERAPAVEGSENVPNSSSIFRSYSAWVLGLSVSRSTRDWELPSNPVLIGMLGADDPVASAAAAGAILAGASVGTPAREQ